MCIRDSTRSVAMGIAAAAFVVISILLGEYLRANQDLAEQSKVLASEVASVKRLSAVSDLDELLALADGLFPPPPTGSRTCLPGFAERRSSPRSFPNIARSWRTCARSPWSEHPRKGKRTGAPTKLRRGSGRSRPSSLAGRLPSPGG